MGRHSRPGPGESFGEPDEPADVPESTTGRFARPSDDFAGGDAGGGDAGYEPSPLTDTARRRVAAFEGGHRSEAGRRGVSLGVKLPTGSYDHTDPAGDIDRDSQIGTGSTDLLLGAFHRGDFAGSLNWNWFAQAQLDLPVLKQGGYRPGLEADAALGVYYEGWALDELKIAPVGQIIGVVRGRDNGAAADPDNTGYQRVLLAPGIEFRLHPVKLYADVEIPVYQNMKGNQLVAPALFKVSLSYMF